MKRSRTTRLLIPTRGERLERSVLHLLSAGPAPQSRAGALAQGTRRALGNKRSSHDYRIEFFCTASAALAVARRVPASVSLLASRKTSRRWVVSRRSAVWLRHRSSLIAMVLLQSL